MEKKPRVYFARAMDNLDKNEIFKLGNLVAEELTAHGMHIIDTFDDQKKGDHNFTFEEKARKIVEGDLELLKTADAVLMDCSIPNRSYIGCICELVYAYLSKIPVVVYVGSSGNDKRSWLQYHATNVCKSRNEAIKELVMIFKISFKQ